MTDPAPDQQPTDPAISPAEDVDAYAERLQARTEELFGTGAIPIQRPATGPVRTPPVARRTDEAAWTEPTLVRKGLGGSAFSFAVSALIGSFFMGWLAPVAVLSLVLGILAVRRPAESSRLGAWAIGLSILALVYSAGWIWWVGTQLVWW
ncbi:hypothetical protein [Microbacterium gorillae]|uniref:hypothetical protein n=1 Tax=Microbacterium gorillae TaxID=1231063 RepID=UPI000693CD87|nr:hypothetical protein [Microbacterium gorillae]